MAGGVADIGGVELAFGLLDQCIDVLFGRTGLDCQRPAVLRHPGAVFDVLGPAAHGPGPRLANR